MRTCRTDRLTSLFHRATWTVVGWMAISSYLQAGQPFDYFADSYCVVGLKDYGTGVRIMPDNTFAGIQVQFGQALKPLAVEHKKTLLNGWMPIVVIKAEENGVSYDTLIWVSPLPTAKDWEKAYDWPIEGERYLLWAMVKATNTGGATVEAKGKIGPKEFRWTLTRGQSARGVLRKPIGADGDFDSADADVWLARTIAYWQGIRDKAPRIKVPERKATDAFWASLCYQLISNDAGKFRPGEGFWDNYWLRDGASMEMQYEEVGMWDVVKRGFDYMFQWQRPDGQFDCGYDGQQGPELDGNGQAIWSFWQYYKISRDKAWLAEHYPKVRKAVDWLNRARKKDAAFPGLLPGAPADGENLWDGKHHIVGYDFWNLRGLICAADIARWVDKPEDAKLFEQEAGLYRAAIDASHRKTGLAYFPPSWEKDGTSWGNTETLWPTPIFEANDPRVTATIKFLRQEFGGGYIEGTLQWGGQKNIIHSYLGSFTTMCSVRQGDHEQAVEDFYWYLLHSTSSNGFAELIYFKDRKAGNETVPHTWGGCNYALLLRHMLVDERGEELHILSAVPDWWLETGREIRIEKAPTHFGELTFIVRGTPTGVEVALDGARRNPPKKIVLYLPKSRPLVKAIEGVEVVVREDQKTRWTFSKVVAAYRQTPEMAVYDEFLEPAPSQQSSDKWIGDAAESVSKEPQTIFYKARSPQTGNMWDTWLYLHNGTYYLYTLGMAGGKWFGNISMASSPDGAHWTEIGRVLAKGEGEWMGTGSVWKSPDFQRDGRFIMNFSEAPTRPEQSIFFAESKDLVHWTRLGGRCEFVQDDRWYDKKGRWDCIWTIPRPGGGLFGYWTATPKAGTDGRFGFGESLDGTTWHALPPPKVTGAADGEVGAIEKIGSKYYMMFGQNGSMQGGQMITLVADQPAGPFHAASKNRVLLSGDTYFARFLSTSDALLVNHHAIARDGQVSFAPLKQAVLDREGTLRLGWWKGNEKMKHDRIEVKFLPRERPAAAITWIENVFNVERGLILEGKLRLPATGEPSLGLYVACDKGSGAAVLLDHDGIARFGTMQADGSNFKIEKTVDRELPFASPAAFRLLLKGSLMELYVDDILIECYSLPAKASGRIGHIVGGEADAMSDLDAW